MGHASLWSPRHIEAIGGHDFRMDEMAIARHVAAGALGLSLGLLLFFVIIFGSALAGPLV